MFWSYVHSAIRELSYLWPDRSLMEIVLMSRLHVRAPGGWGWTHTPCWSCFCSLVHRMHAYNMTVIHPLLASIVETGLKGILGSERRTWQTLDGISSTWSKNEPNCFCLFYYASFCHPRFSSSALHATQVENASSCPLTPICPASLHVILAF